MRVGFVGLGNIGAPMAERLVKGGMDTVVFDVREQARAELAAKGARAAESCAALAREAEVIGVCVRDDHDVYQVVSGENGLLAHAAAGTVIALHSTILPRTVLEVGRAAAARGIGVLDAPITGGAAGAQSGKLTYIVGGDTELLERCRPVFSTSAAKIVHTGALGSGAATKLCNNLMTYLGFLAAYEAAFLARHGSLSFDALLEVTRSNGNMTDQMLAFVRTRMMAEEQPDNASLHAMLRSFTDLAEKDLAVTLAFAREQGITLPGTALCQQLMARVFGIRDEKRR